MKIKNTILIMTISLMSLTINAQRVYLKNIYTTSTGAEKPVIVKTSKQQFNINFNKTIDLGDLNTITSLAIKTAATLPVNIYNKITQLNYESSQHPNQNAILIVYPSNPLNLGAWNISSKWTQESPTRPTSPAPSFKPTNNPLAQFCQMTYQQKRNAIDQNFLGNDESNFPYRQTLSIVETLSANNIELQKNWENLKKILSQQTDNLLYIV